ncbi:MAG: tetratricopeptide repeat protein [Candidatus Paceibacterota bacterium]
MLIIFSAEWSLFHGSVVGYHAVNILVHSSVVILVFYLFRLIFNRTFLAFITALVYAIHPLNIEAVTYISGIPDPLAAFFMLLGTIFYVKAGFYPEKRRFLLLATFLCFIFALFSKESAVMMPGLLFIADIFAHRKTVDSWRSIASRLKNMLPFLAILASYVVLRIMALNFINRSMLPTLSSIPERIMTFSHAFLVYLSLIFAPLHLHMERTLPIAKTIFDIRVASGLLLIIVALIAIVSQFKKRPELSFGLVWFFIALSPNMNIFIPMMAILSEHWLYMSLPGFFFALFAIIFELSAKHKRTMAAFFIILSVTWIFWIGSLTIKRNRDWRNAMVFFTSTLQENPKSTRVLINLGAVHGESGNYEKALEYYNRALLVDSNDPLTYTKIGLTYLSMGREKDALKNFEYSVRISPINSQSFSRLLDWYISHKEYDSAIDILEKRLAATREIDSTGRQKLLLALSNVSQMKQDRALQKKYSDEFTRLQMEHKYSLAEKIGIYLNTRLGDPK